MSNATLSGPAAAFPTERKRRGIIYRGVASVVVFALPIVVFLLLWEAMVRLGWIPATILPSPSIIVRRAWEASRELTALLTGAMAVWLVVMYARVPRTPFVGNYVAREGVLSTDVLSGQRPDVIPRSLFDLLVVLGSAAGILVGVVAELVHPRVGSRAETGGGRVRVVLDRPGRVRVEVDRHRVPLVRLDEDVLAVVPAAALDLGARRRPRALRRFGARSGASTADRVFAGAGARAAVGAEGLVGVDVTDTADDHQTLAAVVFELLAFRMPPLKLNVALMTPEPLVA